MRNGCAVRMSARRSDGDVMQVTSCLTRRRPAPPVRGAGLRALYAAAQSGGSLPCEQQRREQHAECEDRCADGDGHRRSDRELAAPERRDHSRRRLRQRLHDTILHVGRRLHAAALIDFRLDAAPEVHIARGVTTANGGFWKIAIQPRLHGLRRTASPPRNFTVGKRARRNGTRTIAAGLTAALSGIQVVEHQAYFSSRRTWRASRARCTRIFSAPTVVPNRSAISSYERPSTCFITNASRSEGASADSARSRSLRNSVRSSSSSGVANDEG